MRLFDWRENQSCFFFSLKFPFFKTETKKNFACHFNVSLFFCFLFFFIFFFFLFFLRCKAKNIYFNHVLTKQLCPRISTFRSWSENSKKKVKEVSSPFLPKSPLGDSNLKHVFSYVHKSWKKRKKSQIEFGPNLNISKPFAILLSAEKFNFRRKKSSLCFKMSIFNPFTYFENRFLMDYRFCFFRYLLNIYKNEIILSWM